MLFFLISVIPIFLLFAKSLPLQPLPAWASEVRLLSLLFWQELLHLAAHLGNSFRDLTRQIVDITPSKMGSKRKCYSKVENVEIKPADMSVLDLPDLALDHILGMLPPAALCNMVGVCRTTRDLCRSDRMWEKHMKGKWGRVTGPAARREWEWYLATKNITSAVARVERSRKRKRWLGSLACVWPLSWIKSRIDSNGRPRSPLLYDSLMSWYLSLESGKFWFPAQVYNRENGHVGFMLSCYDAEVSYDCRSDTFQARYPPHGRRAAVVEEGVRWERVRAPPVDTPAHDLHASNCLHDLRPGNHIEIQWRRNKEFPYGWWYGIVGHLEHCDGNEHFCRCHQNDTVVLEFNQYTPGSRWRQTTINRKDHKEEGNETDGFYGGIRKLYTKDDISTWKTLWPVEVLE